MKVAFAGITYGPVPPIAERHRRAAIMYASNHGVSWVADISPDKMVHAAARNAVAQLVPESGAEAVFWCDDDVILPEQAIARLVSYTSRPKNPLDLVSGVYFQRKPPYWPVFASFDGERFKWCDEWAENVLAPVDGFGFGCCVTSARVLRLVSELPEAKGERAGPFEYSKYSEDFTFCLRAAKVGCHPYLDTGILCGHLAEPEVVTELTFKKWKELHPFPQKQEVL